jgi:hypothetical protein
VSGIHYLNPENLPDEDMQYLKQRVSTWPLGTLRLLASKDITFVFGQNADAPVDGNAIYVSKKSLDKERQTDKKRHEIELSRRKAEQSNMKVATGNVESFTQLLMFKALVAAIGDGGINWQKPAPQAKDNQGAAEFNRAAVDAIQNSRKAALVLSAVHDLINFGMIDLNAPLPPDNPYVSRVKDYVSFMEQIWSAIQDIPLTPAEEKRFEGLKIEIDQAWSDKATQRNRTNLIRTINSWPDEVLALLKEKEITFTIGGHPSRPPIDMSGDHPKVWVPLSSQFVKAAQDGLDKLGDTLQLTALMAALGTGPATIDWGRAGVEYRKAVDAVIKGGGVSINDMPPDPINAANFILTRTKPVIPDRAATPLFKLAPQVRNAYDTYMAYADEQLAKYTMLESSGIDAETRKSQQAFFKALQKTLRIAGLDAPDFDYNLRNRAMILMLSTVNNMAFNALKKSVSTQYDRKDILESFHYESTGASMSSAIAHAKIKLTPPPQRDEHIPDTLKDDFKTQDIIRQLVAQVYAQTEAEIPGIAAVLTGSGVGINSPAMQKSISRLQDLLAGAAYFKQFDRARPVLEEFKNGHKALHTLSKEPITADWNGYTLEFPSPSDLLMHSIELAAYSALENRVEENARKRAALPQETIQKKDIAMAESAQKKEVADSLGELRAAYKEALITPEERAQQRADAAEKAAQQARDRQAKEDEEARRRQQAEEARKAAEAGALLTLAPLVLNEEYSGMQRLMTLGKRPIANFPPHQPRERAEQQRLADVTVGQVQPVMDAINLRMDGHASLAAGLFKGRKPQPLADAIEQLSKEEGAIAALPESFKQQAAQAIKEILALEPGDSQLHRVNAERHRQLKAALPDAPVMLVAALGTPAMLDKARQFQKKLFPARQKEKPTPQQTEILLQRRYALAISAMENAGIEPPQSLRDKVPDTLPPEETPAPPPPVIPVIPVAVAAVIPVIVPPVPEIPAPPPPPADIVEPVKNEIAAPEPAASDNTAPISWDELRNKAEAFVQARLQENPPFTMLRASLGLQQGHAITLQLSRWLEDENGFRRVDSTEKTIELRQPDMEQALEMKRRLQTHLLQPQQPGQPHPIVEYRRLHEGRNMAAENDPLPPTVPLPDPQQPNPDGSAGRFFKRGGLHTLRLVFPQEGQGQANTTVMEIPLGVRQGEPLDEPNRRRIMALGYLERLREQGQLATAQDVRLWLRNEVVRQQQEWSPAASINLGEHPEITRDIVVKNLAQHTVLHVENPKLIGSPNDYWAVPIQIRVNGKTIATTRINTHIRDAETVLAQIEEITGHMRVGLERHAMEHPEATWVIDNKILGQLIETNGHRSGNIDWNVIDRISAELPYIQKLDVVASAPEILENGKTGFTLRIQRRDGSLFKEGTSSNSATVERHFTLSPGDTGEETLQRIELFRQKTDGDFKKLLDDAYNPKSALNMQKDQRNPVEGYSSLAIVKKFEGYKNELEKGTFKDFGIEEAPTHVQRFAANQQERAPDEPLQRHGSFEGRLAESRPNIGRSLR